MRGMVVRLQHSGGEVHKWSISKQEDGCEFTDHDGYSRYSEGNWMTLVAKFKLVAENYGMTLLSELS